ncbi:unnamed protein product [Rhizoctonia solani]|uniref:Uncharacterized protein n=1 Tax=Rhizoctonia solani TaxID=456999 RepID=A0A8H3I3A2_9AGAM|nr:unnamed protein product [Rhizoctonia solani]
MAPRAKKPPQPKARNARSTKNAKTATKGKERAEPPGGNAGPTLKGKERQSAGSSMAKVATDPFTPILNKEAFRELWDRAKNDCEKTPTSKTPRELATDLSDKERQRSEAITRRLQGRLDQAIGRVGGTVDAFLKSVEEEANDHLDHQNPHTKKNHLLARLSWNSMLKMLRPEMPAEDYWTRATVEEFACQYLIIRFRTSPGKNSDAVKAITVASWASHIIFCIAYFTYDPETNRKCGHQLLTGSVTVRHELDRHTSNRYKVLGKRELQLVVEYAMTSSTTRGRGPRVQIVCVMMIQCISGARPGTVAASHSDLIPMKRYMTLGDIIFIRVAYCKYDAHITFRFFKGSTTSVLGTQAKHVYKGVSQVHNLTFDAPWWLLTYYIARDALEFKTLDELLKSDKHEIRTTKPDEPFFIKVVPGGHAFVQPIQAATADNLSHQVSELLHRLDILAGHRVMGNILNHADASTVATRHYTMGTATIDVLGLRIGEAKEPLQPGVEERLALNARIGAAITLIAGDLADQEPSDSSDDSDHSSGSDRPAKPRKAGAQVHQVTYKSQRDAEVQEKLEKAEQIEAYNTTIAEQWPIFLKPLDPGSEVYQRVSNFSRAKGNLTKIATSPDYKYDEALEKATPEIAVAARRARQMLGGAFEGIREFKKAITKTIGRRIQREVNSEDTGNVKTKHVNSSMAHFDRPSHLLQDAVDFDTVSKPPDPSNAGPSNAGPSNAGPSKTGPSNAGPSNAGPSNAGPSLDSLMSRSTTDMTVSEAQQMLADIAAVEDADENLLREGTEGILSFPSLSRCGINQDKEQVLRTYINGDKARLDDRDDSLESEAGQASNPDDDLDLEYTAVDDQDQPVIVKDLDTPQVRAMLMRYTLAPIIADREYRKQIEEDGGIIYCTKPDHTEWHDLELRMKAKQGKQYGCPAMSCQKGFESIAETKAHCLSEKCPEQKGFQTMKDTDDKRRAFRAETEGSRKTPRLRDREAILRNSARALASMDKESVIQHAHYYKLPEEEIQPNVIDRFVEMANTLGKDWLGED